MKRILCVVFSLLLVVSVFFNMGICVNGISADEKSASEFAEDVGKMLKIADENPGLGKARKSPEINNNEFATCRLIVKTAGKLNTLNAVSFVNGFDDIWVLQFDNTESTRSAFEFYSKQKYVDFVETDKIISAAETGDFLLSGTKSEKNHLSWGPDYLGTDKFNDSLINSGKPLANITVAVIDSGIESSHEFLKGRIIPTNINTSGSGIRNSSEDDYGHGTQVAGVIADSTLENVMIKPYKVLDRFGQGTLVSIAAGINCAVSDNVDIINISLGFYDSSEFLEESVNNAIANDITVVGAAGNSATDEPYYPSSYSGVIRVSAVNSSGIPANFTNYGNISFAAPGVNIYTTTIGNGYTSCKGTSFSAPFCAAVAAAVKSIVPLASSEDIFDIIKTYSVSSPSIDSKDKIGYGIIFAPQDFEENLSGKTEAPEFVSDSPEISINPFKLEIRCATPDSVIYYTTDGSIPSEYNQSSEIYNGSPITVSESCSISAVAYSRGRYRSAVAIYNTIIAPNVSPGEIEINGEGIITAYKGTQKTISIPHFVGSIEVRGIGDNVFNGSDIKVIVLPSTVVSFGESAFEDCASLETVLAHNVVSIGNSCFKNCISASAFDLGELTYIGDSAFENVCSGGYAIFGKTYSLNTESLNSIPENAFKGSALSEIICNNISSVGKDSFADCDALVTVSINRCASLPEKCFKGCDSLKNISIGGLTAVPSSCFADCPMITSVNLPDAELLMPYAFSNSTSLKSIALSKVTSMFSNAFSGCTQLRELILFSLEYFEDTPSSAPEMPENLETFSVPSMKRTIPNMFGNSPGITYIFLNKATDIAAYTFNGCHNIYYLNLENVTELKENSLSGCSAEFIDLSKLVTAYSLPDNSGIMLSNEFIETKYSPENLRLYSTPNSFIERYAEYKGYDFVPLPIIANELPQYIASSSELISISAIGYNLKYQWYKSTENSNEHGEPIEGANQSSYLFTEDDTSPFYYCVVTQNDSGTVSEIRSSVITKDTTPADYTEYEKAVAKANGIDRNLYIDTSALDHALSKKIYGRYKCEQNVIDEQTKIILNAINALEMNVAKKVYMFSSETDLYIFSGIHALVMTLPENSIYDYIEWSSSNSKAFTVNNAGFVRCVGSGNAVITATVHNPDGSTVSASLEFEKKLLGIEKLLSFLFRWIFVLISKIPVKIP